MPDPVSRIETRTPTFFTPGAIIITSLFGLILVIPVLLSMMVVSILKFGPATFMVPLITIAVATFFLPLGFGNPYIVRLVQPLRQGSNNPKQKFVVQLARMPRNRSGLLAMLEDADDIGFLDFTDSALVYNGDSIRLTVPYSEISDLKLRSAGWRALFAYGAQTAFSIATLPDAGRFIFAERSSCILPTSRKNARLMYQALSQKIESISDGPTQKTQEDRT